MEAHQHDRAKDEVTTESLPDVYRDRGSTLVEVIISIVLIGTLVSALIGAVLVATSSSSVAFNGAKAETVLLNAADFVDRAPQLCEYEQYADAAAGSIDPANPWPQSSISTSVELLTGSTGTESDWTSMTCDADPDVAAFEVQRITITVTTPDGRTTRTLTMVKSDVK